MPFDPYKFQQYKSQSKASTTIEPEAIEPEVSPRFDPTRFQQLKTQQKGWVRTGLEETVEQIKEHPFRSLAEGTLRVANVVRWPFRRFIEHPLSTIITALQKPEERKIPETLKEAGKVFLPKRISQEEVIGYEQIWDNYWQSILPGSKTPEWYKAISSFGTAMGVEPPVIRGVERGVERLATRPVTAKELKTLQTIFKPLKDSLKRGGLDTTKLHPQGNIINLSDRSQLFMNKNVSAVLKGENVRVPRWVKIPEPKAITIPKAPIRKAVAPVSPIITPTVKAPPITVPPLEAELGKQRYTITEKGLKEIEKPPTIKKPVFNPQKFQKLKSQIKPEEDIEQILAEKSLEAYMGAEVGGGNLYSIIKSEGSIAPYKKGMPGALREEYREEVPIFLRNRQGKPLDQMADALRKRYPQLGIETESDLLRALGREKVARMYAGMPVTTPEKLQEIKNKLITKFDIEYPYKQIGAPQTGLAVKTFLSKRTAGEEKSLKAVKGLGKFGLSRQDYTNLAFISERPGFFVTLTKELQHKYSPAYHHIRDYFDNYFKILQQRAPEKFELPWPQSHIRRLQEENLHLKEAIRKTRNEERQGFLATKYKENQELINFYKESKIQYVHIPIRLWLGELFKRDPQRARQLISGTFKAIVGRETPTIQHLVDAGIIKREEVDIRDIMASYGRYVENQLAQLDILEMAKQEGLAKLEGQAPEEWVSLPSRVAPALKGFKLHPAFADNLEQYFTSLYRGGGHISRIMSTIKMMQFYNAICLPMYDVCQAGMLGSFWSYKYFPVYLRKAITSVAKKTENYFNASEEGLFSTPFANPFETFLRQVEGVKRHQDNNGNYILDALNRGKEYIFRPQEMLRDIYNASWTTAWTLDKVLRMASREYLIEKGFTPQEASQLAAKFHADYASVPPQLRRVINKIFFTPTFEIAMDKLYIEMVKNAFNPKVLGEVVKETGRIFPFRRIPPKEIKGDRAKRLFARGLIYTAGILFGKDALVQYGLGFNREQFCRRYTKEVEVEGMPKEVVLVFSNPANIPLRYYHKIKYDEAETNLFLRVANTIKSRLHPVYRIAMSVIRNEGDNFKPVYNPFDEPRYQAIDIMRYVTGKSIRISEGFIRGEDIQTRETQRALEDATSKLWAGILRPITFRYIRSIKDVRTAYQMRNLTNEFQRVLIREPEMKEERYLRRLENFLERLDKISGE